MRCPKCGFEQNTSDSCVRCGIVYAKYKPAVKVKVTEIPYASLQAQPQSQPISQHPGQFQTNANMGELELFFASVQKLFIRQKKEWAEILTSFEFANKYEIYAEDATVKIGDVAERFGGFNRFFLRNVFGARRAFEIDVCNTLGRSVIKLSRPAYWFNSEMAVTTPEGYCLGAVHKKFSIFQKVYELRDEKGQVFANIRSPFWTPWTFKLLDRFSDHEVGLISKKWSGLFQEAFTAADKFMVDYGKRDWSAARKAVILATVIHIDYDYFESSSRNTAGGDGDVFLGSAEGGDVGGDIGGGDGGGDGGGGGD